MSESKIATPADFTPECARVYLRKNESDEDLFVIIRAVPLAKISALFGGVPTQAPPPDPNAPKPTPLDPAEEDRRKAETNARFYGVIRAAAVEPRIRISSQGDPEDAGAVDWDDLDKATQDAWVRAIMVHSGFALPPEAEALVTFRIVRRGGLRVCRGSDGPVPTGEAAIGTTAGTA